MCSCQGRTLPRVAQIRKMDSECLVTGKHMASDANFCKPYESSTGPRSATDRWMWCVERFVEPLERTPIDDMCMTLFIRGLVLRTAHSMHGTKSCHDHCLAGNSDQRNAESDLQSDY